jgi:hypothetical protein
MQKIN